MRASRLLLSCLALFSIASVSTLATPRTAHAANVQACLAASEKGQRARAAGKLREAREQFLVCGAEGCPSVVRHDCTQWQTDLQASIPTVVLGAKDRGNRDLVDVTVSVDDQVLVNKLDGKAVNVDPGAHTFKFEHPTYPTVTQQAVIKEGEKSRNITVTFEGGEPEVTKVENPSQPAVVREHTVLPWVVVGVGVAALATGAVIFATSPDRPANCDKGTQLCVHPVGMSDSDFKASQEKAGDADSRPVLGAVLGASGLGLVAIGLLWHFVEPTGPVKTETGTALRVTPWAGANMSGLSLDGRF
ncbi:hypothetical protein AKJ09_03970 [Labilithrix luteola]|uniref:PEGA domain-containing protein n=1 Tax=Labilithrix luteola TaxID=1391654 RepID=A0A0K1PVB5_9BACT|nr:hypothetical protein [Labilithrix luteola]AKU97306.1 hypothetical protein AKJ09_03970 [Labilithrix luteola]